MNLKLVLVEHGNIEEFIDVKLNHRDPFYQSELQKKIQDVLKKHELLTDFMVDRSTKIKMYSLEIVQGKIKETFLRDIKADLPKKRMNDWEFQEISSEILRHLPLEFQNAISSLAYENGHHAGNEEIITCQRNLVNHFEPYIKAYTKRIKGE